MNRAKRPQKETEKTKALLEEWNKNFTQCSSSKSK